MAIVTGTNAGFVTTAPTADPTSPDGDIGARANGAKFTSPAGTNKVTELGWWVGVAPSSAAEDWEMAIYTHDAVNDVPEAIVSGSEVSGSVGIGVTGWQSAALDVSISPSTTYWLVVASTNNSGTDIEYDYATTGGAKLVIQASQSTLPDPYPDSPTYEYSNYNAAFYAVYEAAAAQSPVPIILAQME